jgi:hypothetical protein
MLNDSHVRATHYRGGSYRGEPNPDALAGHHPEPSPCPRFDSGWRLYSVIPWLFGHAPTDPRRFAE